MQKNSICSGCRACEAICPKACIEINISDKIEFKKKIKEKECIHCRLCEQICPNIVSVDMKEPLIGFNAYALKGSVIKRSSSGGIAHSLYEYCLENSITGIGVLFDEDFNLNYTVIGSEKQIRKAAGSKYVYSDMKGMYSFISEKLWNGERIIFVGLPCHVGGLLNYCKLKNIDIENLITVDIVCHGIVMPQYFKEHINRIMDLQTDPCVGNILFRAKHNPYGITIINNNEIIYDKSRCEDEYMKMFITRILAESCYHCKFAQKNRAADITIKDCSTPQNKRKNKRVGNQSSVLINSQKGMELWERLVKEKIEAEEYSTREIVNEDERLQFPIKKPNGYDWFVKLEKYFGYKFAINVLWDLTRVTERFKKDTLQ